jgi:uncharacterized repeat protein (TIGR01451 family)
MAWPADSQWLELVKGGAAIQDLEADANGGVNVVPNDGSNAAAYIYNDGSYLYYRIRLDGDPTKGGNGVFAQFGWGFEIDTDQNADDYEWLIMCDGISQPEVISLRENTDKTGVGDPSDKAEYIAAEYPLVGNHRLTLIQPGGRDYTATNGDDDYYLDFRLPYDVFKSITGITDNTLIRYFVGSSRSTNNLTDNGADLVAGSSLYEMASDYITPFGTIPTGTIFYDGEINFVEDIGGFGDVSLAGPGDNIYIRVDDADLNSSSNPAGTLRVELTAPSGDIEVVILTATGVAGKYTGSITSEAANDTQGDGVLQVSPDEIITVTYVEAIAADRSQSVPRTDTILFTTTATDVGITKTVDNPIPQESDTVVFTIDATNYGPTQATGIEISDVLPVGLTIDLGGTSVTQGSYAGGVWTVGSLNRYATATLTLAATVDIGTNSQTLTNTALLLPFTQTDGNPANNTGSAEIRIGGTDLRITKTANTLYPAPGSNVTFSIRAFNLGPNASGGIQVTDLLPAGLVYQSHSTGSGTYNDLTGLWDVGTLNVGSGALLTLTATANGNPGDMLTNSATLWASDQPDTTPGNNTESVDLLLGGLDINVVKSVDQPAPTSGSSIVYSLTATNNGPNRATGLQLNDLLPAELTYTGSTGDGVYTAGTGLWDIGTLNSGATATLSINADVQNGFAGASVLNSVSVTALDQPDVDSSNDSAEIVIKIDGTDLTLTKVILTNPTPSEGDTVTFRLEVTNNGPTDATNLNITDLLPPGLSYIGNGNNTQYRSSAGTSYSKSDGVWVVGDLAVSAMIWLEIDATVDSGSSGTTITNVAFITEVDQEDPIPADNVANASISIDGVDLTLLKTVDNPTPNVGETVTYTMTVTNNSLDPATTVQVTDLLPPEVLYLSDDGGGSYDTDPLSLTYGVWTVGTVAAGASVSLSIDVEVRNEDSHLVITNTASITAMDQADPNTTDNSAFADITVNASDISIIKTVDNATPAEGGTITYTITASNLGSNPATGVEVEDILPGQVTLVTSTPSAGSYSTGIWFIGPLAGNGTATLTIEVTVNPFTAGSTITNTATLTGLNQIDTNATNDVASVDIVPVALPIITILKSADRASVNPGEVITYTITVLNSGSSPATIVQIDDTLSPYIAMILDFDDITPPYEAFDFVDAGSSLTFDESTDLTYFDSGGTYVPDFPAGEDGAVVSWQLNMTGSFSAGSQFTLRFKVRVK